MLVPTGAARVFARGVPRAGSPIASPHEAAEACVWDRSSRWGGAWGGTWGQNACACGGGTPVRTVDDESKRDGIHDDHHGHPGLALTLGAFGTGVVDKSLIRTSEKGAHVCLRRYARADVR